MLKRMVLALGFIIISQGYLHTGEFTLFELGGRAATFGGAFVARSDDASAVYYNPAGISFLKGIQIKVNSLYSNLTFEAEREGFSFPVRSRPAKMPLSCYFSFPILDRVSFGMGFSMPHFFELEWPSAWDERYTCVDSKLTSYFIRPVLSLRVSDRLAFGVGLDIVFSNIGWRHFLLTPAFSSEFLNIIEVKGSGLGFSAGFLFKLSDRLQIGGRYQHKVNIDYKGDYRFSTPIIFYPTGTLYLPVQETTSHLTLPPEVVLGIMFSPSQKLSLVLDLQWIGWSVIKSLDFVPEEITDDIDDLISPLYFTQSIPLDSKDSWIFKTGIEYRLSNVVSLRAGFSRHQNWQPTLNPVFPSLGRNVFSIGIGYNGPVYGDFDESDQIGFISVDFYLQFMFSNRRSYPFSSGAVSYDADNWVIGIGVGWSST